LAKMIERMDVFPLPLLPMSSTFCFIFDQVAGGKLCPSGSSLTKSDASGHPRAPLIGASLRAAARAAPRAANARSLSLPCPVDLPPSRWRGLQRAALRSRAPRFAAPARPRLKGADEARKPASGVELTETSSLLRRVPERQLSVSLGPQCRLLATRSIPLTRTRADNQWPASLQTRKPARCRITMYLFCM
jgi:hypothetical protein